MRRILFLLSAVTMTACLGSTDLGSPSDPATETFDPSLGINISQMQKTPEGVYFTDVTPGTGDSLTTATTVSIAYAGYLKTGYKFDQADSVQWQLSQLIPGFAYGMLGTPHMRVGGRRKIVIPSDLAYGPYPPPGSGIPANSTLIFDITLKSMP
ncbi:MAG TPA: FKBP-type peptidyl-prolyl cis-trans isomerase [Gemmatimonadaceae bacterium]